MSEPRLVLCSGAHLSTSGMASDDRVILELDSLGHNPNVNLKLENVTSTLLRKSEPRLVDLLEIASYVYSADAATPRGKRWRDGSTRESWSRDFHFVIPVRDVSFWSDSSVHDNLARLLMFLSDDTFTFTFTHLAVDRPTQEYLDLERTWDDWLFKAVDQVVMFSGGLDSLAGAVELATHGKNLVLVSHRTAPTMSKRQTALFSGLQRIFTHPNMLHIPVWVNKDQTLHGESTQRTRSFLFCALGALVANIIGTNNVVFFENGIVSLNLPIADEVLRARASRTTHPLALQELSRFCSLVVGHDFGVTNPFAFKTKTEVVDVIARAGASELIAKSCSCANTMFQPKTRWHCGSCSQCIDRRIAILAACQDEHDDVTDYVSDVFIGPRKQGYEQNVAIGYVRHAKELQEISDDAFAYRFSLELSRASRGFKPRGEAAQQFISTHKRHADSVMAVMRSKIGENANSLALAELDETCMVALVCGQRHRQPSWRSYADRITKILSAGVPVICASEKPKNEPHLQEICDGLLSSHDLDIQREFPFMRWSSSMTKPDWSVDDLSLWIELKYVRRKPDILSITEDIAADITKYGDNGRYSLFVIYDPLHLISSDRQFSESILHHPGTEVRFIR